MEKAVSAPYTHDAKDILKFLAVTGIVVSVILFLVYRRPESIGVELCMFHALTGLHCPGCGGFRAMYALVHGDIIQAFDYNAFTMTALPFLFYLYLSWGLSVFTGKGLPKVFLPQWVIWTLFGLIMAFWVLRNVPLYPFTVLAP